MGTMRPVRSTVIQTKPTLAVPRGGQAEPLTRVTYTEQRNPKGVVHFIGGALVGATPQATYPFLVNRMAQSGYTVVQTAYPFTFAHEALALDLQSAFDACVADLRQSELAPLVPESAPVHGVGHSNGALMHLLISSLSDETPVKSNVLISYNNKEVSDAIPIPGFIERVRPVLVQGRERGVARNADEIRQLVEQVLERYPVPLSAADAGPFLSQISSCLVEIEEGAVDFTPTPAESRDIIADRYAAPSTLVLRFKDDGIDESPDLVRTLKRKIRRRVNEVALPGSHITPCGALPGNAGDEPLQGAEAVGLVASALTSLERAKAADVVIAWLDRF